MDISVVIPLYNEAESLPELASWIERVMNENNFSYEILFINDGSRDNSMEVIRGLQASNPYIHCVSFSRNYGKSPALDTGFARAKGDVVITMDADLQDSPDEIPELYRMITVEGYDLVSGWKKKRYDPLSKTIHNLHDFNCGLKAYKRDVVKHIEVYGDMHRYIPYLAKNAGYGKIGEKVVHHQARKYGVSKFGLDRFVNGYLDLASLWFQTKFGIKPMHFFGLLGSMMFLIGFIAVVTVLILKIVAMNSDTFVFYLTKSVYFYLSLTFMVLGVQFFCTGFIGELITRNSVERRNYLIAEEF